MFENVQFVPHLHLNFAKVYCNPKSNFSFYNLGIKKNAEFYAVSLMPAFKNAPKKV